MVASPVWIYDNRVDPVNAGEPESALVWKKIALESSYSTAPIILYYNITRSLWDLQYRSENFCKISMDLEDIFNIIT